MQKPGRRPAGRRPSRPAAAAGGGTVALPAGSHRLPSGQALLLGGRVQLVGAGAGELFREHVVAGSAQVV